MINTVKDRICYLKDDKERALRGLAYFTLILFALSLLIMLLVTIFCCPIRNLGALWKFLLHNWMKLQLIAFFVLLAIYMPCCIKEFLRIIYKFAVRWNHSFRTVFNDSYDDDQTYIEIW